MGGGGGGGGALIGISPRASKWLETALDILKGIVHPKMKMLSLITHPHVVPNP